MNRLIISLLTVTTVVLALFTGKAIAQQKSLKDQLAGSWMVVSNDNTAPDGTKRQPFGPNPKGLLILSPDGHYTQIITRADQSKFKANNRLQGTPEENTAAVHGTTATFGTWSTDEANKMLIVRIEGGMFPNQAGTESKRTVAVTGDQLKSSNPNPGSGGTSETVYRRASK